MRKALRPIKAEGEHVEISSLRREWNSRFSADERARSIIADRPRGMPLALTSIRQTMGDDSHDCPLFLQQSANLDAAENLAVCMLQQKPPRFLTGG